MCIWMDSYSGHKLLQFSRWASKGKPDYSPSAEHLMAYIADWSLRRPLVIRLEAPCTSSLQFPVKDLVVVGSASIIDVDVTVMASGALQLQPPLIRATKESLGKN